MKNNKSRRHPHGRVGAFAHLAGVLLCTALVAPSWAGLLDERSDTYQWRLCPAGRLIPIRPGYTDSATDPGSVEIRADSSRLVEGGISQFSGDVEVVKGGQALRAEVVTYDDDANMFVAEGRTHIWNSGVTWSGESATYDLDAEVTDLSEGRYWLLNGRGRGYATNLRNDAIADTTTLQGVNYTTCPLSEESWRVSASKITLNHKSDRGSAVNAVLRVRDVPVFYFPYVNFPLSDKRKSGFLAPSIGTSNRAGIDSRIPYYWNIAPNQDATLTPRIVGDRGVMLESEYRYMQSTYQGRAQVEYLPSDDLVQGADRSLFSLLHNQYMFGGKGRMFVNLNNVSDDEYFEDFGGSIASTSQRFLNREVNFRFRNRGTFVRAIAQSFQTIDPTIPDRSKPYRILPKLEYLGTFRPTTRLTPSFRAETTYFDHDFLVTGGRVDMAPAIQYQYIKPYLSVTPRLTLRHTEYFLDDPASTFDDNESRTVPVASLDASLFAERDISLFGRSHLQTFEPRLFYLLAPHVPQDDIPRFDGGLLETSFRNIFRDNRFSGGDRIGDANQVTTAITSRILDTANGREFGRVSVGQIFYFRDREVTLPGSTEIEDSVSELIAEAAANLGADWSVRGTVQWDPNQPRTEKSAAVLRFRPNIDTVVNIGYRLRRARTDVEQTDISFRLPIMENLAVLGRWNFSLLDTRALETIGGIEYESCCWGLRIVGRRFLRNAEGEFDTGVFAQIEFRGLGGVGQKSGSFLRRAIAGYEDPFE